MIRLVIFDLDDTLIDTWNASFPITLKIALKAMMYAGLELDEFNIPLQKLEQINNRARNTSEALTEFLQEYDVDINRFVKIGCDAVYGYDFENKIHPFPGALELLDALTKRGVDLALVTRGEEKRQSQSMQYAGIRKELFKDIYYVQDYDKTDVYRKILARTQHDPVETLVVGDRYATDLLPARKIGTKVAWVPHGRGANFPPETEPDYTLKNLAELIPFLD